MNYRPFEDIKIAEVGLGTWQLGSTDWGGMSQEDASQILQTYVDNGGNFIDTADVYGMGISERFIGQFLKTQTSPIYVATKLGRRHDELNGWPQNFSYDYMKRHVGSSLENLGLDQIFLEQLHCIPTDELRSGKVFGHLRDLQQDGLIKYWGASVETTEEALICLEQEGISSLQIIFNLFRQHLAEEFFELAKEKNVSLIVRVPLASGLLTGKFTEQTVFPEADHRNYNANGEMFNTGETFSGIEFKEGVRLAKKLSEWLPDEHTSQWAIRWILDHPQVTTVIPGASKVSQVLSNVKASDLDSLPVQTYLGMKQIYNTEIKPLIRGSY